MENLTKHQLILVALLISFVTSIATGIVTISLMDQAPKSVTQTINRVVEKTVERVVTEPNKSGTVVKETIVVKEEDKIVEAIEKNAKSMVRIYKKASSSDNAMSLKSFAGLGVVISKDGDIATDDSIISPSDSYSVVLNDGREYDARIESSSGKKEVSFLKLIPKEKEVLSLTPAVLADSDILKLGQTVISLGGKSRNSVFIGVITSFVESDDIQKSSSNSLASVTDASQTASTTTSASLFSVGKFLNLVETNIAPNDSVKGGLIINLSSEVVGIRVIPNDNDRIISFIPSNEMKKNFAGLLKPSE